MYLLLYGYTFVCPSSFSSTSRCVQAPEAVERLPVAEVTRFLGQRVLLGPRRLVTTEPSQDRGLLLAPDSRFKTKLLTPSRSRVMTDTKCNVEHRTS